MTKLKTNLLKLKTAFVKIITHLKKIMLKNHFKHTFCSQNNILKTFLNSYFNIYNINYYLKETIALIISHISVSREIMFLKCF